MEDLLPVLTAWLEAGTELTTTLRAALAGEVAFLPLEAPPFEQTTHILEVHVVGAGAPIVLLAEPVGFAKNGLFPLQVRPLDDEQHRLIEASLAVGIDPRLSEAQRFNSLPPPPSIDHIARQVSRPPPDPLVGRSIGNGKFRVDQLLGSGAAGRVYRALHRDLQKAVAVKVLHPFYQADPGFTARFEGEALAASRIDHPNVMRILDFGQEPDGMLYIVMEFLEGRDLHNVIEADGALPTERLVPIAMQICAGLSVAHDAGIVHRDIKPENVILVPGVDDEGRPTEIAKVCDFGIAQTRSADGGEEERLICGTPEYMSPEQWQALDLDLRTDIYALGATLYELATRYLPITGQSTEDVFTRVLTQEPQPPSLYNADIDPRVEAIIMRCLAKDREARYANARDVRAELRLIVEPDDGATRLLRRRELLDASKLTPLEDPAAGFTEFFIAVSSAVMRTGYYEKAHREAATALARMAAAVDVVLKNRGELSFARRDVGESVVFTIVSGAGEVRDLKKLLPNSVYELYAEKFGDVFVRRNVVSLALRDGADEIELTDLVDLLSGPEIPAEELRQKFLSRGFTSVSILFVADLLGRKRKLPWQVDLCVSRLARDLQALPLVRGMDIEQRRLLRSQIIGDVIRALGKSEQLRALLDNADLIAAESVHDEQLADIDVVTAVIDALSVRATTGLARHLLEEIENASRPAAAGGSLVALPVRTDPRELLLAVAGRFARDRTSESDEVLRQLYDKSFVALPDLPPDLQMWIRAEAHASALEADSEATLTALDGITDAESYDREASILEFTTRVLGRRGQVAGVLAVLERFKRHSNDGKRSARIRQRASSATLVLEEPDVLMCIAHTLLGGAMQTREPAQRLLAAAGAKAAAPLSSARLQLPGSDASLRARFVSAYRNIGADGLPLLAQGLERFGPDTDATLVEDFLRAIPDVPDDPLGRLVERFVVHPSPSVRRAAATAMASLSGFGARAALTELLAGNDDGVRLGALAGLRRVQGIDADAVARIDKILGNLVPGGEELRAAAAAALAEARPEVRATALGILSRVVRVQRRSFVGLLKDAIASPQDSTMVLLASARSLVVLGGDKGKAIVKERAASSSGVLRQQLEALVQLATG